MDETHEFGTLAGALVVLNDASRLFPGARRASERSIAFLIKKILEVSASFRRWLDKPAPALLDTLINGDAGRILQLMFCTRALAADN